MKSRCLRGCAAALAVSLSACGSVPPERLGQARQSITSGTADDVDTSAVFVVAKSKTSTGYCSGVVVSRHVVLTAAHCASADYEYSIFLGADYTEPTAHMLADNFIKVVEHHAHPKWDTSMGDVNDIGVLITAAPIPRPATAINRRPIGANDLGRAIRIVGYGQTTGDDKAIGRRNMARTMIADFDDTTLEIKGLPNICLFDSGGPTFMNQDGVDVVAGIHVITDSTACDKGYDMRVDAYAELIDGYIQAADPSVDAGAPAIEAGVPADDAGSTDAGTGAAAPSPGCTMGGSRSASTLSAFAVLLFAWALRRRRVCSAHGLTVRRS